jgi:hypothetical protein
MLANPDFLLKADLKDRLLGRNSESNASGWQAFLVFEGFS